MSRATEITFGIAAAALTGMVLWNFTDRGDGHKPYIGRENGNIVLKLPSGEKTAPLIAPKP